MVVRMEEAKDYFQADSKWVGGDAGLMSSAGVNHLKGVEE